MAAHGAPTNLPNPTQNAASSTNRRPAPLAPDNVQRPPPRGAAMAPRPGRASYHKRPPLKPIWLR
eukprot:2273492-Lingulodinium_polyedra.AAC.1